MVGAKGFEPSTSCSQSRCATRLRHAPKKNPRRCGAGKLWGERWDLNPRPPGPQPGALPTELLPPRESSYKQDNFFWQDFFSRVRSGFYLEKKLHSANRRKRQPAGPYRPWTASRQCPLPLVRARSRMPDGIKHHMINIGRKAA